MDCREKETLRLSLHDDDSKGLGPALGEESGFVMIAGDTASFGSPVLGLIAAESPAGSQNPVFGHRDALWI